MVNFSKVGLFLLCLLAFSNVKGQKTFSNAPELSSSNILISYYGDYVSNPGLQFSYEKALLNKVKTKSKVRRGKGKTKYKTHRIELVPNFAFYQDPGSHTAFIPNVALQYKKINHHRWLMTVGIGGGMFTNFVSEAYEVTGNSVSEPSTAFSAYPAASFHWSFGRVKVKEGKMRGINLGISNQVLFNFNNNIQLAPAINLGYRF